MQNSVALCSSTLGNVLCGCSYHNTAAPSSAADPTRAIGRVASCQAAADGAGAGAVTGAVAGTAAAVLELLAAAVVGAAAGVADVGEAAGATAGDRREQQVTTAAAVRVVIAVPRHLFS